MRVEFVDVRGAVGGGADLVRDVDAAFARERGGVGDHGGGGGAGHIFQAVADGLAVGGGGGLVVEGPNPLAAVERRRGSPAVQDEVEARGETARHRVA